MDLSSSVTNLKIPGVEKSKCNSKSFQCFCFIDNEKTGSRDMIPMDELGPGKFSHRSNPPSVSIECTVTHGKVQLFL